MYPEEMVQPMREEVTRLGVSECRTGADIDQALSQKGTVLAFINSVCGCAAGKARPAIGMAMQHSAKPDKFATVFAGGDDAAVAHLRSILSEYPPSSPSMALFVDGKPVHMIHRHEIERRGPEQIAQMLTTLFDQYCTRQPA